MAESSLPPSERGSISRLIEAVSALVDKLDKQPPAPVVIQGASPVNWWDAVPELDGVFFNGTTYTPLPVKVNTPVELNIQTFYDRIELSIRRGDGRVYWQRVLYTKNWRPA